MADYFTHFSCLFDVGTPDKAARALALFLANSKWQAAYHHFWEVPLGLAVAVPAVLGYNLVVRNNRVIIASFHAFAEDLLAYLTTGARVPSSMDHHRAHRLQQQTA